jgi:Fe-S cluster biogenesis protein NfuA
MNQELFNKVRTIIENDIKPYIEADGGNIHLKNVEDDGTVYVELAGACAGCPWCNYDIKRRCRKSSKSKAGGCKRSQIGLLRNFISDI